MDDNDSISRANDEDSGVIGMIHKKNRFYGWTKLFLVLSSEQLVLLPLEQITKTSKRTPFSSLAFKDTDHSTSAPFHANMHIIGNLGNGVDLDRVSQAKPKQRIEIARISKLLPHGDRDLEIFLTTTSTCMLRASNAANRNAWLGYLQLAVKLLHASKPSLSAAVTSPEAGDTAVSIVESVDNDHQSTISPAIPALALSFGSTNMESPPNNTNGVSKIRDVFEDDNDSNHIPTPDVDEFDVSEFFNQDDSNNKNNSSSSSSSNQPSSTGLKRASKSSPSLTNSSLSNLALHAKLPSLPANSTITPTTTAAEKCPYTLTPVTSLHLPSLVESATTTTNTNLPVHLNDSSSFGNMFDCIMKPPNELSPSPEMVPLNDTDHYCPSAQSISDNESDCSIFEEDENEDNENDQRLSPSPQLQPQPQPPKQYPEQAAPSSSILTASVTEFATSFLENSVEFSNLPSDFSADKTVTTTNVDESTDNHHQHISKSRIGNVGLQEAASASKYSSPLNTSQALPPSIARVNRSRAVHDWHAKRSPPSTGGYNTNSSSTSPQQKAINGLATNKGVSKIVKGCINRNMLQHRSPTNTSNVHRVRRVRSDIKVNPLKLIHLNFGKSSKGDNHLKSTYSTNDAREEGSRYVVRNGRIECASEADQEDDVLDKRPATSLSQKQSNPADPYNLGEFGRIRQRLRAVEQQKKLLQQAQLLDKEGIDEVRIADILENRKDVPLAVQIQESRDMQLAKQKVLLEQQVEQGERELEQLKRNLEQQQKYQQFKRQSLHPIQYSGVTSTRDTTSSPTPHQPLHPMSRPVSSQGMVQRHHSPLTNGTSTRRSSYYQTDPNQAPSFQSVDGYNYVGGHPHPPLPPLLSSNTSIRQPAMYRHPVSENSYGRRSFVSPLSHTPGVSSRRISSYGYPEQYKRSMTMRSAPSFASRSVKGTAPPVPPLPSTGSSIHHYSPPGYAYSDRQHNYCHSTYSQPAAATPSHHLDNLSSHHGPIKTDLQRRGEWTDKQRMTKKRTEMDARNLSLLQRLDMARKTGEIHGGSQSEKLRYTKGGYQNFSVSQLYRDDHTRGCNLQYLEDDGTLLVDRVYDAAKGRSAFLKKLARNCNGVEPAATGNVVPAYPY